MRNWYGSWVIVLIILLIDFYVYYVIRTVFAGDRSRMTFTYIYWTVSVGMLAFIVSFPAIHYFEAHIILRSYIFAIILGILFAKLIGAVFFLADDIRRGFLWIMSKTFYKTGVDFTPTETTISRSVFLTWTGIAMGSGLFASLLYGFSNKYDYQVKKVKLTFANLPQAFRGLRILHISDIHSGSFTNKEAVNKGVDMALAQKADIILFTGDLVNDKAIEMKDYMDVFSRITAPMGVYSTLGNHDYGDYTSWPSPEAKMQNLEDLKEVEAKLGWKLLMNEHVILEKKGEKIALIGIENWSAFGSFPKYGKLKEAYTGTEEYPFKILMSHDPSHWDAQIRPEFPDIDLTLSGHTHGMQFGVENPYFKWSPVQWFYKEWAGLYEEKNQKIYVNRGWGFIGYPGRVGILPEITLIELA
ncbi:MAG: metallophosphoesterase [Bacteroidetes bacterium]|nr:metallophosphoesterase [Bacteroidota bacterium]